MGGKGDAEAMRHSVGRLRILLGRPSPPPVVLRTNRENGTHVGVYAFLLQNFNTFGETAVGGGIGGGMAPGNKDARRQQHRALQTGDATRS